MKSRVSPAPGLMWPPSPASVSSVRTTVVPTAQTRPPAARLWLMIRAARSLNRYDSSCIRWRPRSSLSTGLKVPGPTCRSSSASATPLSRRRSSKSRVKCNPAVGAATLPSCAAYTVW